MYKSILKRMFDIIFSILGLPFLLLILLVIGPTIYFENKGTIFYNAERLGKDGKVFKMYKLRSMKLNAPDIRNADGSTFNSENDSRLLKVGKFIRKTSLDETPQLLNILKGEMSFIGPRPDLPEHKEVYIGQEIRKLEVRPGVTGYNQAYFRNTIPWKERIKNDIYYIDHVSILMDIKIFIATFFSVLLRKNIFMVDGEKNSESNGGNFNEK